MFDRLFAGLRPPRPPRPATPYESGLAALERGQPAEALAAFERAVLAAGNERERAEAHNKRGVALVELRRFDAALDAFCEALALDERCAPALVNLGSLLLEEGHPLDAIDYYEAALRADDKYAVAHRNLGIAFKRIGRRGEAVRHLRAAARLESRRSPGRA